ncbi:DUF3784 domain-containing protein [Weeksellaceae bacterium TAE3-ERU29]|nr:DUF3784 domain-containing protein [Weeksellaceae bacterium TAE3-ERU29]
MPFIYVLLGFSLLLIAIGFIVTEKNAKYILSGYNTMSEEEQNKVDIKSFILYFKKFHIFLGISLFVIGAILNYFSPNSAGIFIVFYPILAYIYLAVKGNKFYKQNSKSTFIALIIVLLCLIGLLLWDFRENKLITTPQALKIEGSYGETIEINQIKSIELVNKIPEISYKVNGASLGTMSKGYFKTQNGEKVKLILNNSDNSPYILIIKKDGEKIYYSSKSDSDSILFNEIKKHVHFN